TARGCAEGDLLAALNTYVYPICGSMPVAMVATEHVLQCLDPIWATKNPTAKKLRACIEDTLNWATTRGYRKGLNPARWAAHLEHALDEHKHVTKHHAALAYGAVPAFMDKLREADGLVARALEMTVLCATRKNETLGATWDEINLAEKIWTIPAARM